MRYILDKNVLPGDATLVACCRRPTNESISLLVAFFRVNQEATWRRIRCNLSSGKRACMLWEPGVIPKKVKQSEDPSTFSKARGIPSVYP